MAFSNLFVLLLRLKKESTVKDYTERFKEILEDDLPQQAEGGNHNRVESSLL